MSALLKNILGRIAFETRPFATRLRTKQLDAHRTGPEGCLSRLVEPMQMAG